MSRLTDELDWLRCRFTDLSIKVGEDRNWRREHDKADEEERQRMHALVDILEILVKGEPDAGSNDVHRR